MVLGKFPVPGVLPFGLQKGKDLLRLQWMRVGVVWTFLLSSILSLLSPSLWEAARYILKNCLEGMLTPKQTTNQPPDYPLQTYELEQNNASKQKVGHCDKTTLPIFSFYSSEYLCVTDNPCLYSAKNIQWF